MIRKLLYRYLLFFTSALLLSCQQETETRPSPGEGVEGRPIQQIVCSVSRQASTTRCPLNTGSLSYIIHNEEVFLNEIQDEYFVPGEKVNFYNFEVDGSNNPTKQIGKGIYQVDRLNLRNEVYYSYMEPVSDGDATQTIYYPVNVSKTYVCGLYPAEKTSNIITSFSVEADQSTQDAYRKSDLMWGAVMVNTTSQDDAGELSVEFQHKLCKIWVNAKSEAAESGQTDNVYVTEIRLKNIATTIGVTSAIEGTLNSTLSDVTDVIMYDDASNSKNTVECAAIIPPQAVTDNLLEVTDNEGRKAVFCMEIPYRFEAGKEYYIELSLNSWKMGTTVNTIALWSDATFGSTEKAVTPLAYCATGNVKGSASPFTLFAGTDAQTAYNNPNGYYNWEYATMNFGTERNDKRNVTIDSKKYHMPSFAECCSVIPATNLRMITTEGESIREEDVEVHDLVYDFDSQFKKSSTNSNVIYGLRYIGTNYLSAWRYELKTGTPNYLEIKSFYIGRTNKDAYTINTISNDSWWTTNNSSANMVTRQFTSVGYYNSEYVKDYDLTTNSGFYWCGSAVDDGHAYGFYWNHLQDTNDRRALQTGVIRGLKDMQPVRLFLDDL